MPQALADLKVLDLSRVLAMPYCSMMLGDLGAEIIRVERPGVGDETRPWGPPWIGELSAYYLCTNRNKKAITVDLKKKEGQEINRQLARQMLVEMRHPKIGKVKVVGSPLKLSETPVQYRIPPPLLGEHTEEVLRDVLGYDKETIARLKEGKVI